MLLVGIVLSLVVFWYGGKWFGIPADYGHDASLLRQAGRGSVMLVVGALIFITTLIGTLVVGRVRADAGVFCAALGLMALSLRGGSVFYSIVGQSRAVFYQLGMELILLFALLAGAWWVANRMTAAGLARRDPDFEPDDDLSLDQKLIATATHVCAMATLVLVTCQSSDKGQALASVGVASLLASVIAGMIAPTRPSFWYWAGPLIVGLLGYVTSSFNSTGLPIGQPRGYFANLARPLPLDYASTGTAGAMLGYWLARAWHREREHAAAAAAEHGESNAPAHPTSASG